MYIVNDGDPRDPLQLECDRQLIVLSLAQCALLRPGFESALMLIAEQFAGLEEFRRFKRLNEDRVKPMTERVA